MKNSNRDYDPRFTHPRSIQIQVDRAFEILTALKFDLSFSQRTTSDIKTAIHYFYEENPNSRLHARTLVGILSYMISQRNNEHLSLTTVGKAVDVSPSWLSRNKRRVMSVLQRMR